MNEKKNYTLISGLGALIILLLPIYYFVNEHKETIVEFSKQIISVKCISIKAQMIDNLSLEDKNYFLKKTCCDPNYPKFKYCGYLNECNSLEKREINWSSSKDLDRQCYTKAKYGNIVSRLSNEKFDINYFQENMQDFPNALDSDFLRDIVYNYEYIDIPNELMQKVTNEVLELIAEENEELRDEIETIILTSDENIKIARKNFAEVFIKIKQKPERNYAKGLFEDFCTNKGNHIVYGGEYDSCMQFIENVEFGI